MQTIQADITNCDTEPIRIPGAIQSHGFLLLVDKEHIIRYYSENIATYINLSADDLTGAHISFIEEIITSERDSHFLKKLLQLGAYNNSFEKTNPFTISLNDDFFYVIMSFCDDLFLLEFEPVYRQDAIDLQKIVGSSLTQMLAGKHLQSMLDHSAMQVKNIIGYDRVMVYRFAEDGHGEVISESKNADLEPWLGLHYPASDIPVQARELYKINITRHIADVNFPTSAILPGIAAGERNVDLTHSQLRAVSPVHIQYLKNMGVASSFSISLLYRNELWGLIACHNYTPLTIDYKYRESAKLIGQVLSSALEFRQTESNQHLYDLLIENVNVLTHYLQENVSLESALMAGAVNLMQITFAGGVVLKYDNKLSQKGKTPTGDELEGLIQWIHDSVTQVVYQTNCLSALYPPAAGFAAIGSGVLIVTLSRKLQEYIIWFKPEFAQTINWAGHPDKTITGLENGLAVISPRHSFKLFLQKITHTSLPWSGEEIKAVTRIKEEIAFAANAKAGAIKILNAQLQHAYEELDTFSYTISHDLKNPITAIKMYVHMLVSDPLTARENIQYLNKIVERANKMNFLINSVLNYSRIGRDSLKVVKIDMAALIQEIISDHTLDHKGLRITVGDTPDLNGDLIMITQVFSNLISNAIKYSTHRENALVHIAGELTEEKISYSISDNGIGIKAKDLSAVFVLFARMENAKAIEGSGVGLAIVKRILDKHKAIIYVNSDPDKGSVFTMSFHKDITALLCVSNQILKHSKV